MCRGSWSVLQYLYEDTVEGLKLRLAKSLEHARRRGKAYDDRPARNVSETC